MLGTQFTLLAIVGLLGFTLVKQQCKTSSGGAAPRIEGGDVLPLEVPEGTSRGLVKELVDHALRLFHAARSTSDPWERYRSVKEAQGTVTAALSLARRMGVRPERASRVDAERLRSDIEALAAETATHLRGR